MMMIFLSRDATRSVAYTPWRGVRLCVCVCVSGCSYFVRKGLKLYPQTFFALLYSPSILVFPHESSCSYTTLRNTKDSKNLTYKT